MSTSPDTQRADDRIVTLLSQWLAFHVGNEELRERLEEIGTDGLVPAQAEAVAELLGELTRAAPNERGDVEMTVRETLEALALGA